MSTGAWHRLFALQPAGGRYAVGKALPNYSVRIPGPPRLPLPVNHTGEICIGGSGLALVGGLGFVRGDFEQVFSRRRPTVSLHRRQRSSGRLLPDGTLPRRCETALSTGPGQ